MSQGTEQYFDKTIENLRIAIQQDPQNDNLYYTMGRLYHKMQDWDKAIEYYMEAININENSPAKEAIKLTHSILDFYNKEYYNQ